MSNLTDFFPSAGGGGGGAVGDLALKPAAKDASLYVDSNSNTWLKSGVGETDLTLYPDLPLIGISDAASQNGNRSWLGNIISPINSYQKFLNDSFNNKLYYTQLDGYEGYRYYSEATVDNDGKIENPFIDSTTSNRNWGTTYVNQESYQFNGYGTLPQSDGTDHWCLMPNFTPSSSIKGIYGRNFTNSVSGAGELATWKLRKVTGGTINDSDGDPYTFSASDDITPSGVPTAASDYDLTLGANSGTGLSGIRIGNQFAVTDTQILINVKISANYFQYYYYFGYCYPWQVHTFNKSTGAYEGMLHNNAYVINDNGGTGYVILHKPNGTVGAELGNWVHGDKDITSYSSNHLISHTLTTYVHFGYTNQPYGTPIETDNSGRVVMYNGDALGSDQLENAKGSGANTDSDSSGGTIEIFEKASGVKTMYGRGITTSTVPSQTGLGVDTSNTNHSHGPELTTEDTGNRLYVKAL